MTPLVSIKKISLPYPLHSDHGALDQQIRNALGLASLEIPVSVLRSIPGVLGSTGALCCAIGQFGTANRLIAVDVLRSYSLALDLGSTNLVATLYDNAAGKQVLTRSRENPQVKFGSDILTRMHHTMGGSGEEVYRVLMTGVNELITDLCREARIETRYLHGMAAAGNTAMTHYFLGLDISTIPVAPWVPLVRAPGFLKAAELGLNISPEAPVFVFPNAGSYVGGDITAGIIAAGLHQSERTSVLVDVGTNVEVVIGNRDWIIVAAGAAGPALEEGISRIGRRARKGIVYDVEIGERDVSCRTFDNAPPEGICGSGMISLVHGLFRAGIIDQTGSFTNDRRISTHDGERAFVLACRGGTGLAITQTEIRNFLRSKAAMFTLLLTLTRAVGIAFRDIAGVFVSGALGSGIDVRKAAEIGMMPSWPEGIVKAMGNTSIAGCRMVLEDAGLAAVVNELIGTITYKHMHDDPEFMKEFRGAVFLPHTDPALLQV